MAGLLSKARPRSHHASAPLADQLLPDAGLLNDALMMPADAREMLHLMRSTCGRVQGLVSFRSCTSAQASSPWQTCYCYVNVETGSLRYETHTSDPDAGESSAFETLVPDLRACAVHAWYDRATKSPVLYLAAADATIELDLRPKDESQLNRWFAALLCWHPLRANQDIRAAVKTILPAALEDPFASEDQDGPLRKLSADDENTVLKRDKAILINAEVSPARTSRTAEDAQDTSVTCIIRANGELSIHANSDASVCATVSLGQIPRSSIQRIGRSVFGRDRVLGIYPQYARSSDVCSRIRPIHLTFTSRGLYEAWFVLLRSTAAPELYGSRRSRSSDSAAATNGEPRLGLSPLLRIEQSLEVRVTKTKFREIHDSAEKHSSFTGRKSRLPASYYAEILLDEHVKAKTAVRSDVRGILFWNETHTFQDLPSTLRSITVRIKKVDSGQIENSRRTSAAKSNRDSQNIKPIARQQSDTDEACGCVVLDLSELETTKEDDRSWPLTDAGGGHIGELTLSIQHHRQDILMEREYHQMFDYLRDFSTCLTLHIYDHIPSQLPRLAECFLNIFQTANRAGDWLKSLVEAEIYDTQPKTPIAEEVTPAQIAIPRNDSHAFILFRGTTLLSKALDTFMRRCGEQYLEETIGSRLREINIENIDCEVDPSKLPPSSDIIKNWQHLVATTKSLWVLIYHSAAKCPKELRDVFRHIRNCAQTRYGDSISSIVYTSVSGFLFLRFFCAAILNPQTFGIIESEAGERTKRTFMLVAKSLQGLANLTTFGKKEVWMAPMDDFCSRHRKQFEDYIDAVCAPITSDQVAPTSNAETKPLTNGTNGSRPNSGANDSAFTYTAGPLAAMTRRLAPIAREGYLSLPHLIDPARNLASLVDLWLDHAGNMSELVFRSAEGDNESLARFHRLCLRLGQKTRAHARSIEQDASPSWGRIGIALQKWVVLAERIEACPALFWRPPSEDINSDAGGAIVLGRKSSVTAGAALAPRPGSSPAVSSEKGKSRTSVLLGHTNDKGSEAEDRRRGSLFSMGSSGTRSKEKCKEKGSEKNKGKEKAQATTPATRPGEITSARPSSINSTHGSATSKKTAKSDSAKRRVSPPRSKEDLALRKLGWI